MLRGLHSLSLAKNQAQIFAKIIPEQPFPPSLSAPIPLSPPPSGRVAEWFKAAVLKNRRAGNRTVGSNPNPFRHIWF